MTETYNLTGNYSTIAEAGRDVISHAAWLPNLLLLFTFLLIMLMGATGSRRLTGMTNVPQWAAIAGLVTSTISFLLYSVEGIVSITTVTICISVTILSTLFYLVSEQD